ncbi:phage tail protein [Acinetobacter sp. B5B]|uniref:phage tail-collar fiber domain-containing protein n=1 Tax=Acinetobacter baretiae TaxID=2605383 RepID=UPI0018C20115|nr:phage tail protein [Acinetobacter baretiae]MBF7682989.1 phage tail protein [Acinetobacter baretiae]
MSLQFYMTDVGKQAVLNADNLSVNIQLTKIVVGIGQYDALQTAKTLTALQEPLASFPLNGGAVNQATLRLIASIDSTITSDIFEIGLMTDTGVLFAVSSQQNQPILKLVSGITTVLTLGMVLSDLEKSNVQVSVDANSPMAVTLMNQHLAHGNPHPQYALISALNVLIDAYALDTDLSQAVDYLSGLLTQHKSAKNPHPQYLLASTFGVNLPMTASVDTKIVDINRVYGWDGIGGDINFAVGGVRWWNSKSGTFTFKPWRSYGQFLLYFDFQPQGSGNVYVKTFSQDGTLISDNKVRTYNAAGYNLYEDPIKYVFELPQGGYAEIAYDLSVWNKNYGNGNGSIYVNDRPKSFSPVGYTSTVDSSNQSGIENQEQAEGYSVYPNYQWFYYSDSLKQYVQLSDLSTFDKPVKNVPHYHRDHVENQKNKELWAVVEVAKQTVALPNSDYTAVSTQVVRAATDSSGDVVLGIPFEMRTVATPNNETLVYSVAYYATEVTKTTKDSSFPEGSLTGKRTIYVNRTAS